MSRFKVGDKVRLKLSVKNPQFRWGEVKPGDEGVVVEVGRNSLYINFPRQWCWRALDEEIELSLPFNLENI